MTNLIAKIDRAPHAIVAGMVYMALEADEAHIGRKVVPVRGQDSGASEREIKDAFVAKNGGRFIKDRWYA